MITLDEILSEWGTDSKIDRDDLSTESLKTANLQSKYLQVLAGIKMSIIRRKAKLETLMHEKTEWVSGRLTKDAMDAKGWDYDGGLAGRSKPLKGEMDGYVKVDPDVQKLRVEIQELELSRDTTIEIVNSLQWRHQSIRNSIDYMKFMAGG